MLKENIDTQSSPTESKGRYFEPLMRVTKVSKYLSLGLFIALPCLGFWLGMQFPNQHVSVPVSSHLGTETQKGEATTTINNISTMTTTTSSDLTLVENVPDETRFSLDSMHALWGGHRMTVSKSGVVKVAYQDRGEPAVTATGQATTEELENLAEAFSQHGFTDIKDVPIKGYPDESSAVITERTKEGEVIKVSQSFNEQTTDFNAIHNELIKLADRVIKDSNL